MNIKLKEFLGANKFDILAILLLFISLPVFYFKLGQSSLVSWDEAWYAEVSRNILKFGNPINLIWNGKEFLDHPPFAFWLTAIVFKLFGINAFWARFASVTLGFFSLIFLYLLGKDMFNWLVGFLSSFALLSAPWFIFRARSGNLDVILTFLFILSFYLTLKTIKESKYKYPLTISLAALFLTKTMIPFAIIPSILFLAITSKKKERNSLLFALGVSLLLFLAWFLYNYYSFSNFLSVYLSRGTPGIGVHTSLISNIMLIKSYLHEGIGNWFWPSVLSLGLGLLMFQKRFFVLALFISTFLFPFIFSNKGQIWHYVPLYPFMLLVLFGAVFVFSERLKINRYFVSLLLVVITLYVGLIQIKRNWLSFIDVTKYISDEEILSREASKFSNKLFLDDNFTPTAVFYSSKDVTQLASNASLTELFSTEKNFLLITYPYRLTQNKITQNQYKLIKMDRDKILIESK